MDLFVVTNSQYHLRNHDFVIPRFWTVAYGKHSLAYLGPIIWSILNISIRSSESLDPSKKRIKLVNFSSLLDTVMSNTVDMTRVEKILFTTCTRGLIVATRQVVSTRQTELSSRKVHLISSLEQRSDMNPSKVQARDVVYTPFSEQRSVCMCRSLKTFSTRTTRLPLHRAPFQYHKQQNL